MQQKPYWISVEPVTQQRACIENVYLLHFRVLQLCVKRSVAKSQKRHVCVKERKLHIDKEKEDEC